MSLSPSWSESNTSKVGGYWFARLPLELVRCKAKTCRNFYPSRARKKRFQRFQTSWQFVWIYIFFKKSTSKTKLNIYLFSSAFWVGLLPLLQGSTLTQLPLRYTSFLLNIRINAAPRGAAFINILALRCGVYLRAAFIRGRRLFEEIRSHSREWKD